VIGRFVAAGDGFARDVKNARRSVHVAESAVHPARDAQFAYSYNNWRPPSIYTQARSAGVFRPTCSYMSDGFPTNAKTQASARLRPRSDLALIPFVLTPVAELQTQEQERTEGRYSTL
jgi:hypothetical protein